MELRLFSGGSMLGDGEAFDFSRIVCSTKKSFIKDALSTFSVWTKSSLQSEEIKC